VGLESASTANEAASAGGEGGTAAVRAAGEDQAGIDHGAEVRIRVATGDGSPVTGPADLTPKSWT
jgi:hypothetical protein